MSGNEKIKTRESLATSPFADSHSYSGCDIVAICTGTEFIKDSNGQYQPHAKVFKIGDIQTLTYSIHSDQGAARVLGRRNPKTFTRGPRTIAGSLIFTVFDRKALYELSRKTEVSQEHMYADTILPFDILLYYVNEYKQASTLAIYGVQVSDEGQSQSVQDAYLESTMTYVARDIELLEPFTGSKNMSNFGTFFTEDKIATMREVTVSDFEVSGVDYRYRYRRI